MALSLINSARPGNLLRLFVFAAMLFGLALAQPRAAFAQPKTQGQSDLTTLQRINVMRSKLDAMRRSLTSAIA
ncbi:MAG TPA: hypothetical protein VIU65_09010, partial [Pyrinomonadaceae bacterium]